MCLHYLRVGGGGAPRVPLGLTTTGLHARTTLAVQRRRTSPAERSRAVPPAGRAITRPTSPRPPWKEKMAGRAGTAQHRQAHRQSMHTDRPRRGPRGRSTPSLSLPRCAAGRSAQPEPSHFYQICSLLFFFSAVSLFLLLVKLCCLSLAQPSSCGRGGAPRRNVLFPGEKDNQYEKRASAIGRPECLDKKTSRD